MDRERKLLYVVAVLAPILEIMTFAAYHETARELQAVVAAAEETNACHEQLLRTWAQCLPSW